MFKKFLVSDLYLKIRKNQFEIKNLSVGGTWQIAKPESPFTTKRLLVGHFNAAQTPLTQLVKEIMPSGMMKRSAHILIHPLEKTEGGLCEVEERIFTELGLGAGAFKVTLHTGDELSDSEALDLLAAKS